MACKALHFAQPSRLEVSCPQVLQWGVNVHLARMAVQWTAQHWSLAETLKLLIRCSSEGLHSSDALDDSSDDGHDVEPHQERLACALRACVRAPPPDNMRALQLRNYGLEYLLSKQPAQHLVGALCNWFGCMRQLRLLCIDFLPAPALLQQLPRLRHLSLVQQSPKQDELEAVLAALPGGLQTLKLPDDLLFRVEGGEGPVDLTRFSQLIHVACAARCAKLRLPCSCRVHTDVWNLQALKLNEQFSKTPILQYTSSAKVLDMWYEDGLVEDALFAMLQLTPQLRTLQLYVLCPCQG